MISHLPSGEFDGSSRSGDIAEQGWPAELTVERSLAREAWQVGAQGKSANMGCSGLVQDCGASLRLVGQGRLEEAQATGDQGLDPVLCWQDPGPIGPPKGLPTQKWGLSRSLQLCSGVAWNWKFTQKLNQQSGLRKLCKDSKTSRLPLGFFGDCCWLTRSVEPPSSRHPNPGI